MKNIFIMIMFAGLLAPVEMLGQHVYKESNKIIMELTVASGMPKAVITTDTKIKNFTSDNTSSDADNFYESEINQTLYHKFEIAKTNENLTKYTWKDAYDKCRSKSGGNWRLPTAREMLAIAFFSEAITALGGSFSINYYWTQTEKMIGAGGNVEHIGYVVHFGSYYAGAGNHRLHALLTTIQKTTGAYTPKTRCIREITD